MYIDAHNHLEQYGEKLATALAIIERDGIKTVGCAMDTETYLFTRELAKDHPLIIPAFGIHPWKASEYSDGLDKLDAYINEAKVIGEVGLDFYWVKDKSSYSRQMEIFVYFIAKARENDKPLSLHTKGAESEILALIKKYRPRPPMIHWYSGPLEIFEELLAYGCYFTVGADLGYSDLTAELIKRLPSDRILTETDGPTALEWVNGAYGYPDLVKGLVDNIAGIKKIAPEDLTEIIYDNLNRAIATLT